jgi:hypothetical protein
MMTHLGGIHLQLGGILEISGEDNDASDVVVMNECFDLRARGVAVEADRK